MTYILHSRTVQIVCFIGLMMVLLLLPASTLANFLLFVGLYRDGDLSVDGLEEASGVAVSADGQYVYVAARTEDALAVFSRDEATGSLTFVEEYVDGFDGVDGLDGAIGVAVSPDNKSVYVTGYSDDALAVFDRNQRTGELSFVEFQKDGFASVDGLDGAEGVAVSSDNKSVYVAGSDDDALVVFARDQETGRLSFVEVQKDGTANLDGFDGACSVVVSSVSSDYPYVYVASSNSGTLTVFDRDQKTGQLSFKVQKSAEDKKYNLDGASAVAVSRDGEYVYVTNANALVVFKWDHNPEEELDFEEVYTEGLSSPQAVVVSDDNIYVAVEGIHPLVVISQTVTSTGTLGIGDIDNLSALDALAISSDGQSLYGVSSQDHALVSFDLPPDAKPVFDNLHIDNTLIDGLDEANGLTHSPDGRHVYVVSGFGEGDHSVVAFERNAATGKLAFVQVQKDGVDGVDGIKGASAVAVSPDGEFVYVTGASDDALAIFVRNERSGRLKFVGHYEDDSGIINGIQGARSVAVSPDNAHVYVAGYADNAVAVFRSITETVNTLTGTLLITDDQNFIEVHQDGIASADGLRGAIDVVVSPDGRHVYVAGFTEDGIGVYERAATTGRLNFVEVQRNGVDGVEGLAAPRSIVVSPDDQHVYVAAQTDDALVVFERDTETGQLNFVQVIRDDVGGVDGLDSPRSLKVASDGGQSYVYVASFKDRAISIFRRDPETGRLSFVRVIKHGVDGVWGLDGLGSLTVTPDSRHIYTASFDDGAVAAFKTLIQVYYLPFVSKGQSP